jgi:hypothetical protein
MLSSLTHAVNMPNPIVIENKNTHSLVGLVFSIHSPILGGSQLLTIILLSEECKIVSNSSTVASAVVPVDCHFNAFIRSRTDEISSIGATILYLYILISIKGRITRNIQGNECTGFTSRISEYRIGCVDPPFDYVPSLR